MSPSKDGYRRAATETCRRQGRERKRPAWLGHVSSPHGFSTHHHLCIRCFFFFFNLLKPHLDNNTDFCLFPPSPLLAIYCMCSAHTHLKTLSSSMRIYHDCYCLLSEIWQTVIICIWWVKWRGVGCREGGGGSGKHRIQPGSTDLTL